MRCLSCASWIVLSIFPFIISAQRNFSCSTPNGEEALCLNIYDCPVILEAVRNQDPDNARFLRASQCGYEQQPLVCCGSVAFYQQQTMRSTELARPTSAPGTPNILLPGRDVCGTDVVGNRILGGMGTDLDEFPWMALLEYRKNGKSVGHGCGGTLINNRYVLTAAHCIVGLIETELGEVFRVRLGEYDRRTNPDCKKYGSGNQQTEDCNEEHLDIGVEESIAHPLYVDADNNKYHDIGILRLLRNVKYTDFIKPICLPTEGEMATVGDELFISGWGTTEYGTGASVKQKLNISHVSNEECANIFRRFKVSLRPSQICAGGEKKKDSCQGDSGGPLMKRISYESNKIWYQEGVVSFGAACGSKGVPGIYTRVATYLDWILDNMRP